MRKPFLIVLLVLNLLVHGRLGTLSGNELCRKKWKWWHGRRRPVHWLPLSADNIATFEHMQLARVCGVEDDCSFHALVACKEAVQLWEGMRKIWPIPSNELLSSNYWGGMAAQYARKLYREGTWHGADFNIDSLEYATDLLHGKDHVPVEISVNL